MNRLIAVASIVCLLTSVGISSQAYADNGSKTWLFLAYEDCTVDDALALKETLLADKSIYDNYTIGKKFETVCTNHFDVKSVPVLVPLLKKMFPGDKFIFLYNLAPIIVKDEQHVPMIIYKDNSHIAFQLYLASLGIYPAGDIPKIYGKSFVRDGYAYSDYHLFVLKHEWTHLTLCAEHPEGTDKDDPTTWVKVC